METDEEGPSTFQRLKAVCVPLLGNSLLSPASVPTALKLLAQLRDILNDLKTSGQVLAPAIITYVFFPLSTMLRRNELANIPDQVLERLLDVLSILCDSWWWEMDVAVWEQVFMLCSAILGGIDRKGKGKDRDDETKVASVRCLRSLLRERNGFENLSDLLNADRAATVLETFKAHTRTPKFMPVLGQTLDSLLIAAESSHLPLQRSTLEVLSIMVNQYLPEGFLPSVLPGIVSAMSKVALGTKTGKGWANGDIVASALLVMQYAIVRAVGDDVCLREGAVRRMDNLEDLLARPDVLDPESPTLPSYTTRRTASWLRGTSSQLHIAMNALSPLVKHPTPAALVGLVQFSANVLAATTLTVPQSQPLLMSFLLSLKSSSFDRVSEQSDTALRRILLAPSNRHQFIQTLLQISKDNLAALPRLLLSHADTKVEHVARIIASVCSLSAPTIDTVQPGIPAISAGVAKLLGPHGGIEKWGWSLLSNLQFISPPVVVTPATAAQLLLEGDLSATHNTSFPELTMRHVSSRTAYEALEKMFRALGATAGEEALFSVEWFVDTALNGRSSRAVAALWCACRLLEGVGRITDSSAPPTYSIDRSRRLEKFARDLARRIGETWDDTDVDMESCVPDESQKNPDPRADNVLVEHVQGLVRVSAVPGAPGPAPSSNPTHIAIQPMLHRVLRLQLLSVTAGILEARFPPLLLHTLYPVLHGLISDSPFESASAFATLSAITNHASFATPANLLLSNFDYALDAVSRRLTRRWLDVDATRVLAVLVRLIGRDVVQKAGDVVEECFDRLDEYHGYGVIVDGLVEVLQEVVKVIEEDDSNRLARETRTAQETPYPVDDAKRLQAFAEWLKHRQDQEPPLTEPLGDSSYPREAWGKTKEDMNGAEDKDPQVPEDDTTPETPAQALTRQIVSRSLYFLTHGSPQIRARILLLLTNAVPVLPESALLPAVHQAWPFVLNRLNDSETFVVSAAAMLIAALAQHAGDFMYRRIWDDVWPRFREQLRRLERADASSALARRGPGGVGTESAYTHSHRLYRAILQTLTSVAQGVQAQESTNWEIIVLFRRFLHSQVHEELQACARALYGAMCRQNEDAVWLALCATTGKVDGSMVFLRERKWDIERNVSLILSM